MERGKFLRHTPDLFGRGLIVAGGTHQHQFFLEQQFGDDPGAPRIDHGGIEQSALHLIEQAVGSIDPRADRQMQGVAACP
jgi:hypothetical protein